MKLPAVVELNKTQSGVQLECVNVPLFVQLAPTVIAPELDAMYVALLLIVSEPVMPIEGSLVSAVTVTGFVPLPIVILVAFKLPPDTPKV